MNKFEQGCQTLGHDIIKVVDYLPHVTAVIATSLKDEPEIKTLVTTLITQASAVIATDTAVAASKGVNLGADTAALAAAEQFFTYFKNTFLPSAEAIYKDIAADVK